MVSKIFISSVQSEFAEERVAIRDFVHGDPLLSRHFEVFIFEDQPAQDQGPSDVYLREVDNCGVYLCLLGQRYGFEGDDGISPTEHEFDRAVARRRHRLAFIKNESEIDRHPKEVRFVEKVDRQVTRRKFGDLGDLIPQIYASLVRVLEDDQIIESRPFEMQSAKATFKDIDPERVRAFQSRAARFRNSSIDRIPEYKDVLRHLNLTDGKRPYKAAALLFGWRPKTEVPSAEIKCLNYVGTQAIRPVLSYQLYDATLPEQIDAALEFVMSKLARHVGVRDVGAQATVHYEIPREVVGEAIVNAIAHRDYTKGSSVQVTVFADRVEVANPGELPSGLTPDQLRVAHPSIPRNPLINEVLFLSGYVEKVGTGTTQMIFNCREAGIPEPQFRQVGDQWVVTIWRDWLTPAYIAEHGLNERQAMGLELIRRMSRITNIEYRNAVGTTSKTAARDLDELVTKGILIREGAGRGVRYVLSGH